jgi:hypothetical protein
MPRRHVIISGTGRAGTTFLVQLLTKLGLDTGFRDPAEGVLANCDAGMEVDIRSPDAPYIVKNPWLCDHLDEVLRGGQVAIDHALVPIRDLFAAAQSRRDVTARSDPSRFGGDVPGGLWHTTDPASQEAVLAGQLYKLLHALEAHEIPTTMLHFPRIVRDPGYLRRKLGPLLGGIDAETFLAAFRSVSRPELVHDFESLRPAG